MKILKNYLVIFLMSIVGATPLPKKICEKIKEKQTGRRVASILEPIFIIGLFLTITAFLVDGSFNPFLYFRF